MKPNKLLSCLIISLSCVLLLSVVENAEAKDVYKLKLVTFLSRAEMWMVDHFTKNWEKMSDGRLQFQVFTGGELVPTGELMHAVASGVADLGMNVGSYVRDEVPVASAESGLPFAWATPWIDSNVLFYEKGLINLVREEYASKGKVHYVGPASLDPYQLVTTKEYRNLAELKKAKIRASGDVAKMLNDVGISTVFLPFEEAYTALSSGTINGIVFGSASAYYDTKIFEVAKYLVYPAFNITTNANLIANPKAWNSLPDDLKAIIEVGFREFSGTTAYKFLADDASKLELSKKKWGVKTITLPDADVKVLRSAAVKVWDEYAKKSPSCKSAVDKLKEWQREAGYIQ